VFVTEVYSGKNSYDCIYRNYSYVVASAVAELGLVGMVSDVVIIIVRVITGLLALVVEALLSGSAEETEEAIANVTAGSTLELLELWTLGDLGRPKNLSLLRELFAPTAGKVFEVHDTYHNGR